MRTLLSLVCVLVLLVGGSAGAAIRLGAPAELYATGYGRVLSAKIAATVALVVLGWRNRTMWVPAARSHRATAVVSRTRARVETALMVVAVWLLGVGTLKDLALVQLVGVIVGTYSSIFLAPPMLVWLREREPRIREHNALVAKTRAAAAVAGPGEEPARIRVGALVPGEHQGNRAQPRRKSPNRPAGRKS